MASRDVTETLLHPATRVHGVPRIRRPGVSPVDDVALVEEVQALRDRQRHILPPVAPVVHVGAVTDVPPDGIAEVSSLRHGAHGRS